MPTYEYECTRGHRFEVTQRITEEPLKRCKHCRSRVQRLISSSLFILKGGGWYSDGYTSSRSGSNGSGEGSASKESKDSSGSSDSSKSKTGSAPGSESSDT
jgi:putative FmdB family regulatory protein